MNLTNREKKRTSDTEYLKMIREHIESSNQGGTSYYKLVNDELHEIDSSEYRKLIEIGGYRVFKYP